MAYYKKALYSRIYNKIKFDPVEKFAFVVTLCIATLFSFFSCVKSYAYEGDLVEYQIINGISCSASSNYFTSGSSVSAYPVRVGYTYTIARVNDSASARASVYSTVTPELNVPYSLVYRFTNDSEQVYNFMPTTDGYLCLNGVSNGYEVYEQKVAGMDSTVGDLVDNVGVNQIWDTFGNGVDFVGVVVLVAFGVFLVALAIKKISKGKSEF